MTILNKLVVLGFCLSYGQVLAEPRPVLKHPFSHFDKNYSLTSGKNFEPLQLDQEAPELILDSGLSERFKLREKSVKGFNLHESSRIESAAYGFELDSFPICDLEVKVHRTLSGSVAMLGELPPSPARSFSAEDFAPFEAVKKIVDETFIMASLGSDVQIVSREACLHVQSDFKPVYKIVASAQGLTYDLLVDDQEVYKFDPRHFHADATAVVYPENAADGQVASIPLGEMDDSGFLTNKYFQSCLPTSESKVICTPKDTIASQYSFAKSTNGQFAFNPQTEADKFIQTSVFAHTNKALAWLQSKGYKNFGTAQVRLLPHAVFGKGEVNNALYQPATSSAPPMILVGDGDGIGLQNLGTDGDVVSHELGHHVIFHSVTTTSGESLVLHEGLSDFLTFARTGDACLGESICPNNEGQGFCAVPKQCLRTGENDLVFGSPNLPSQAHYRGQFISGMLWDMKTKDGIPTDDLMTMVLGGIDLLVHNSGYKHFVVSLLLADHANFSDKYCAKILARAKTRGLSTVLADVTCDTIYAGNGGSLIPGSGGGTTSGGSEGAESEVIQSSTTKKSSKKSCGTLSGASSGQSQSLLLILSLPIAISLVRRKKSKD